MVMVSFVREVRMISHTGRDSRSVQVKTCGVIQRRNSVLESVEIVAGTRHSRHFVTCIGRRLLRSWLGQVSSSLRFAGVVLYVRFLPCFLPGLERGSTYRTYVEPVQYLLGKVLCIMAFLLLK